VLGAAQADARCSERATERGIVRRVGVGAYADGAELVGPSEDRVEVAGYLRIDELDGTEYDDAGRAVDRDDVALASTTSVPLTTACFLPASILSASAPHTHGLPIPRATTAACEVLPPCEVRMPWRQSCRGGRRGWSPSGRG
jgi:hypothetical protein